eukprot:1381187-Amphidinium_carterae.2
MLLQVTSSQQSSNCHEPSSTSQCLPRRGGKRAWCKSLKVWSAGAHSGLRGASLKMPHSSQLIAKFASYTRASHSSDDLHAAKRRCRTALSLDQIWKAAGNTA